MDAAFFDELRQLLPMSRASDRKAWASRILRGETELEELLPLLDCGEPVATRFLWFLSEFGEQYPAALHRVLPRLMERVDTARMDNYAGSLANFWILAGVPAEMEGQAIDLLFDWLNASGTNVTVKSRAMVVLEKLSANYPELKQELRLSIEGQMNKYSKSFEKKSIQLLNKLSR